MDNDQKTAQQIHEKINNLSRKISTYHQRINEKSIWLFLATLSCYSVNIKYLQIIALLITLGLFIRETCKLQKSATPFGEKSYSFPDYIKYIDILIDDNLSNRPDLKQECLDELKRCKQLISYKTIFFTTQNLTFTVCWLFFGLTFLILLYHSFFHLPIQILPNI